LEETTETGIAIFPIDLGVLVAVTTTSSRFILDESVPRCAKDTVVINKNNVWKKILMLLESGAKLIQLVPRFIMELSDEKAVLNYDNSVTRIEANDTFKSKA
jgi:hypothetical protein